MYGCPVSVGVGIAQAHHTGRAGFGSSELKVSIILHGIPRCRTTIPRTTGTDLYQIVSCSGYVEEIGIPPFYLFIHGKAAPGGRGVLNPKVNIVGKYA